MKFYPSNLLSLAFLLLLILSACCESRENWVESHGFGPITEPIDLDELDKNLALEGKQIFTTYYESCHGVDYLNQRTRPGRCC